jgi:transcription elongation factor GreA
MSDGIVYLTQEGYEKLKQEIDYLKNVRRPEVSTLLQLAIAEGDLKENANYHDAKEQQALLEGRIKDLEDNLRRSQIIKDGGPKGRVNVGSTVTIAEEGFEDEEEVYRIVGGPEADPDAGRISNESPIGRALLGSKKGDMVKVQTPRGETRFKILKIE